MKKRKGFVSNSSSCSFFVYLKTDHDAKEFNNIKNEFLEKFGYCCKEIIKSINDVYDECDLRLDGQNLTKDFNLKKDNVIYIRTGEDNEGQFRIDQLNNIYYYLINKYRKIKIYRDSEAHYTFGDQFMIDLVEKIRKENKNEL